MAPDEYEFTTDWFSRFAEIWRQILARHPPSTILEIGAWEGRASCFLIDACASEREIEIHCVDTWRGGVDNAPEVMPDVERRFDANLALAQSRARHAVRFHKHKQLSVLALTRLVAEGRSGQFDLIYVDGSHQAPDVLTDAVLAFELLRVGGVIVFDDYLWSMEPAGQQNFYNMPKPAVDAFVTIFQRKLSVMAAPLYQLYAIKRAD